MPLSFVCVCVPFWEPNLPVDWTLLVAERIANIGRPLEVLGFCHFNEIFCLNFLGGFGVFKKHSNVHNGGVTL